MWLVTIPNKQANQEKTFSEIQNKMPSTSQSKMYRFEIPKLVVGTLDTLMSLSDDLTKIGMQVENTVRKVEKQYQEVAGGQAESLKVNDTPVETYFKRFQWDYAQYQFQGRQLSEIVGQIQGMCAKTEEELKLLSNTYTDKNLAVATAKRKKVINLATSDFEDFLTPQLLSGVDVINSENLLTLAVVVPKNLQSDFTTSYDKLGSEIAAYGGPDWTASRVGSADGNFGSTVQRAAVKGSPVVPGSLLKIVEEGDSIMFFITVLKGQYKAGEFIDEVFSPGSYIDYIEPLKYAFREKRYIIREISYNPENNGGIDRLISDAENELNHVKATTLRWCKAHFGEVFNGWVHLKVIQAFVESVLRYGLPVDFMSSFIETNPKSEKEFKTKLSSVVVSLHPELLPKKLFMDEEDDDEQAETLPFVCLQFPLIGV